MRIALIFFSFFLGSNVYAAENSEPSEALKMYLATHSWMRSGIVESSEWISPIDPEKFLGRARTQFRTSNFEKAILNLDIYLSIIDDNSMAYVLRGLSKKLSDSPDVVGACADLLRAASSDFDVSAIDGIETYCDAQTGWAGR